MQRTAAARAEEDLNGLAVNMQRQELLAAQPPEDAARNDAPLGVQDTATSEDVAVALATRRSGLEDAVAFVASLALGMDVAARARPRSGDVGPSHKGETSTAAGPDAFIEPARASFQAVPRGEDDKGRDLGLEPDR